MDKVLRIKRDDSRVHPSGPLWTYTDADAKTAFLHFSDGSISILEDYVPELVAVANLHGWTVTQEETNEN